MDARQRLVIPARGRSILPPTRLCRGGGGAEGGGGGGGGGGGETRERKGI